MGSFLKDQADDEEFRIRRGLANVGLFFELNLDEDELRRCQELFGRIAVHDLRVGDTSLLIKRYPALTLATLVGHAGLAYDQGRYWESFWEELGLERDQDFENALRRSLSDLLGRFGLRDFPEFRGRNYVMTMAMHAGIPVRCLGDLVESIEGHIRQGRDATGAALLEWLTAPGMDYRLNRLGVPVRNFLTYGGEIAVDVLDRIIEFLAYTLEDPGAWNNLVLDTSTTGLPSVLLSGLIEHLHERPFLSAAGGGTTTPRGIRQRRSPVMSYSVQDDEVIVSVPYPEVDANMPWKLTAAGSTRDVYSVSGWGVDEGEHPPTPVAVTAPAREVLLVHEASGANHSVPVFDSADPLLLFTVDGKLLRRSATLPRGLVLAMAPRDAQVVDAASDTPVRVADDPRKPSGWTGWRVQTIDLTGHDSILLRRNSRPDGPVRGVHSLGSPSFVLSDPIPGLLTPNGLHVFAERPCVDLPPYVGSEPVLWRVRARRSGDRHWLVDCEWESSTEETTLDPFDGIDAGLLGLYEIEVSSGHGTSQQFMVFMVEGIGVDHGSAFRRPVGSGLAGSVTEITSTHGLTVDANRLAFDVTDREREIRVRSGDRAQKLVVRPPYAETRIDRVGTPTQWRTSPRAVSPQDLEEHAIVAVRVPGAVRATISLLDEREQPVQREEPESPSNNVFQVSSRRFVDTARRVGVCSLVAFVVDETGENQRITIADVRPARLCERVRLEGPELVFEQLADLDDPGVWVWAATAPWQQVSRLTINGERTVLPEGLQNSGDLLVMVFADDPFAVVTRPNRPDRDALRVTQSGWMRDTDPGLDGLAQFLSGAGEPPLMKRATDGAWAALAILPWDAADSTSQRTRSGLFRILGRHPRAALEALGSSTIPQNEMMALLIRTQLVDRPFSSSETLNDLHPNAWVGCMIEISDLPSLRDRGRAVAGEKAETLAYLETQGGQELMDLLRAGKMTDPRSGVFDPNVLMVHGMTPEQVEELFECFRLVPGALLDIDTRTSATVDAFHRRADWMLEDACRDLPGHVSRVLRALKKASPALYDLVVARNEVLHGVDTAAHPWMLLSMQSLALAAVARLEALGEFEFSPMTAEIRDAWAVMAEYFPAMVAGDLLVAEALAAHLAYGDLIGETS